MRSSHILVALLLALAGASGRELQTTITGGGTCVATGSSGVEASTKDAIVNAYANAVKIGCSATTVESLVKKMVDELNFCAEAIVEVWTKAFAKCTTFGNAYGCAASEAYASKKVDALVQITTTAIAKAVNYCHCDPSAYAKITASLMVELVAKAKAHAKASVCVGPDSTASAVAYAHCQSQVIAHGTAYAFAKAMIKGGCTKLKATAIATVNFLYESDPYCACVGWARVCLNGSCKWTHTNNNALYSGNFFSHCPPALSAYFKAECAAYDAVLP